MLSGLHDIRISHGPSHHDHMIELYSRSRQFVPQVYLPLCVTVCRSLRAKYLRGRNGCERRSDRVSADCVLGGREQLSHSRLLQNHLVRVVVVLSMLVCRILPPFL